MTSPDPVLPITLDGLLKVWQLLGAPLVTVVILYVRDISRQLRTMNGEIRDLKSWTKAHEKIDDDRDKVLTRELDQIQREIHGTHTGRGGGP